MDTDNLIQQCNSNCMINIETYSPLQPTKETIDVLPYTLFNKRFNL